MIYKDDTLFEDYVEIREMVTGKGSVDKMTHGEFLELLEDLIKRESDQLKEERDLLAYENKNMAEFIKYNDKTLTDTDVGDIATSTVKSGVWDRFRTNAKFDRDGTLLSELPVSALWSDDVWDRFKINTGVSND
jgi:hypothetical protein